MSKEEVEDWKKDATEHIQALALLMDDKVPGKALAAYQGMLNGEPVTIIGGVSVQSNSTPENPLMESAALFVVWNKTLHKMIEVPDATVVPFE